MSGIDWGDVPTWAGAVGAGAAAIGAFLTVASQRKQIGEQRSFIERQSEVLALQESELVAVAADRSRAQARRVSMLATMRDGPDEVYPGIENSRCWEACISNDSDEAIYDVEVRCGSYLPTVVWSHGQPTYEASQQQVPSPVAALGPGRKISFFLAPGPAPFIGNHPPVLTFADADGQHWQVNQQGLRTRVDPVST
ncbi:hypothetical protein ACIQWN_07015 [Streptomyces vinaceus]|uniref:hypothetical protein n=1 Tax=Streptomyces vinaceus TaxID=1960 RepID=UPI00381DEFD3